jgi:inorganic triphosphatase YgiF
MVLDRGAVVAGDRRSSICEIELELKSGDVAALFAFARKLDAAAPLRLGVLTKAERGYGLVDPAVPAFRADAIDLHRDTTAGQALQHIVQACLRQFRLNEDLLLIGQTPEALHQARVALRRLRSALSIFKVLIADEASAELRETLRWLANALGPARSIDVLVSRAPPGALRDRLEAARHDAYAQVKAILASAQARGLMLDLAQWSASGEWLGAVDAAEFRDQRASIFARTALDRLRRKVKRGGEDLVGLDDQARHELRKDAKKLRYAAEFFAVQCDRKRQRRRYKRFVAALEALQDALGALNDLVTAPAVLTELGIANSPDTMAVLFPGSRKKLLEAAGEAHAALVDAGRFWR